MPTAVREKTNPRRRTALGLLTVCIFILAAASGELAHERTPPGMSGTRQQCGYTTEINAVEDYDELVRVSDPYVGNFESGVTVVEYFDPNCPHCKTLHPTMQTLISKYADRVRFFMIPYVLWPYSMAQIESLYIAAQEGKYYEMLDAQFNVQKAGGLSLYDLRQLASDLDLDPDRLQSRLERGLYRRQVLGRREEIRNLGVRGTPTVVINGRFVLDTDAKTVDCLSRLIEEELAASE